MNKKELLGGILAGMMFLSGCKPASEINKTPVVDASATLSGPTTKESPYVTYSPTKEAVSTATPTRPDMGGGAYNSEQQTLIETGAFKDSEQALTAWFKYWVNASNSPFNPETTDIHYKYVFDSTGKSAGVCMESTTYPSVCFALPIINGEVAKVPPTVSSEYTIPAGYGPLQLSDQLSADQVSVLKLDTSLTDSVLGYENGDWVRYKNGKIVASLDLASAQWKVPDVALNPKVAIEQFKLNTEQTYTISADGYLVDSFNQAKMAKWDKTTNTWVDTSLEEKYGAMAPKSPSVPYIGQEYIGGDIVSPKNMEYKSFGINPIWTGNVMEKTMDFDGRTITNISLDTVFRDKDGVLHEVQLSFVSPDIGKVIFNWNSGSEHGYVIGDVYNMLKLVSPGSQLFFRFPYAFPQNVSFLPRGVCNYKGSLCNDEYRKNYLLYTQESTQIKKIVNGLKNGSEIDTNNIVLPAGGFDGGILFYVKSPLPASQ